MNLKVVSVLATMLIIVAGDCDVYSNQQTRIIEKCAQIQDCVSKALLNNRNNLYILDRVFRSTQTQPPTSLIVNYNVIRITKDCKFTRDQDGASSGSGIDAGVVTDTQQLNPTNDTGDCYGASNNYTEASGIDSIGVTQIVQLGWSSTGIYKAIRPDFLVALQPALYWLFLSLAIDDKGLPRTVHLSLNITNTTECELLEDITGVEMKEALEHLTEKLNYEVPGKVWNVTTDSLSTEEWGLLIPMISLGVCTVNLLLYILPSLYDLIPRLPRVISFAVLVIPFPIMALEIFVNRNINTGHGAVIHDILTVVIMVLSILSCPYGIRMSYNISIKKKYWNSLLYPLLFLIAITLTVFSLPVVIGAFIYPTEVIAIIGLFVICLAVYSAVYTIVDWFNRNGTPNCTPVQKKKNRNLRSIYQTYIKKLVFIIYMAVGTVFVSLIIYIILLRHRLESPTSQQLPTLLTFILPIFAGFGSFLLRKTLAPGTKDKLEATDETESNDNTNTPTNQTTHSDSAATDQRSDDTNSSNNQTDPPQGDSPTDDQQHDGGEQQLQSVASDTQRQESPQESEEIQVTVEIHPTNNSDVIQESIV